MLHLLAMMKQMKLYLYLYLLLHLYLYLLLFPIYKSGFRRLLRGVFQSGLLTKRNAARRTSRRA
ncbi:hypothetical protein DWX95_04140 [Butyricicoccus sp. AF22-28AC]|nr:hypothetical protein DWX95_04140 [Butyricicoccus sp. AF22-28AC]